MKLNIIAALALSFGVLSAQAQSVAQPGHQCTYDAAPTLVCGNVANALGPVFEITEFQSCKDGNVTIADRMIDATYNSSTDVVNKDTVTLIEDSNIQIIYPKTRTRFDDRTGDVSMLMPASVSLTTGDIQSVLLITNKTAPDYEGARADEYYFVGSYKTLKAGQQIDSGSLRCEFLN